MGRKVRVEVLKIWRSWSQTVPVVENYPHRVRRDTMMKELTKPTYHVTIYIMIDYTPNRANKTTPTCVNISLAASISRSLCDVMRVCRNPRLCPLRSGQVTVTCKVHIRTLHQLKQQSLLYPPPPTTAQREIMAKSNLDSLDGLASEGICSLLDTDLYKLTMQCAVLRSYPNAGWFAGGEDCFSGNLRLILGSRPIDVTYAYTNRTPDLKITRAGFEWLQLQSTSSFC